MSMLTNMPSEVKKVNPRSNANDRPTASSKRNGKATSKCAALDGCRKNAARKIKGTTHEIVKTKFLDTICFRRSSSATIRTQQSKRNTGGVKAWKIIR